MNELENTKNIEAETSTITGRRKFMVKASATSLVATMPVKAVWAGQQRIVAGVSGQLSGATTSVLQAGVSFEGYSPEQWSYYYNLSGQTRGSVGAFAELNSVLGIDLSAHWSVVFDAHQEPTTLLPGSPLWQFLPNKLDPTGLLPAPPALPAPTPPTDLDLDGHIIAAYLNAVFGFYGTFAAGVTAEDYVINIYNQVYGTGTGTVTLETMITAIKGTYNKDGHSDIEYPTVLTPRI
jgi:hypothetical protein